MRGNNLFVLSLADGSLVQLTNIVAADEKGPHVTLFEDENKDATASQKWIAEEAKKLSDVVARRAAEQKEDEAKRKEEIAHRAAEAEERRVGRPTSSSRRTKSTSIAFIDDRTATTASGRSSRATSPTAATPTDLPARTKVGDAGRPRAWPASPRPTAR